MSKTQTVQVWREVQTRAGGSSEVPDTHPIKINKIELLEKKVEKLLKNYISNFLNIIVNFQNFRLDPM